MPRAQEEMRGGFKNATISQGTNPLSLRIQGTGEYVKDQVAHLSDYFDYIEYEREQSIRGDLEELQRDNELGR